MSAPITLKHHSKVRLPHGSWNTVLDCLCAHFQHIDRSQWQSRMERGLVLAADQQPLTADYAYRPDMLVYYRREVPDEQPIPCAESILYADDNIVVADKPHFLPVTPTGSFVRETLLHRLIERFDNPQLSPLHRIDRGTAGLVLFSTNATNRPLYHALFSERRIHKQYQAIAPALPDLSFPMVYRSRLVAGEPFFRMQEAQGPANTETHIDVLERNTQYWRYLLTPVTGRKHQLRVHMAALGAAIVNDDFYPVLAPDTADDYQQPLQLLAFRLQFIDPVTRELRQFTSGLSL